MPPAEKCERCGKALAGDDPKPKRRQVIDVPPVKPEVTEYLVAACEAHARGGPAPSLLPVAPLSAAA